MPYTLETLFGMKNRSVAVVGGSSGIGLEIACALADLGSRVAIIGRTREKCDKALALLRERSADSLAFQADVTDEAALRAIFAEIARTFGTIDGLVNSAGINHIEALATVSMDNFRKVMDVNFTGLVLCCKLAGEHMLKSGRGAVVNISSLSTRIGKSYYTAYAASKAAIDGFTRALAVEWIRKGINVNSVAPGMVVTDINRKDVEANPDSFRKRIDSIPRGRAGETSSLVAPVIALLSPGCAHIVGQTIFCDGGLSIGDTFVMGKNREGGK